MRRQPRAVLVWIGLWLAVLSLIGVLKALTGGVVIGAGRRDTFELFKSFGPLAAVLVPALLALWVATTAATFRSVLRPQERAWFFIRMGADEARLAGITACASVLVLVLGGVPAFLLYVLANPLMAAAPVMARDIAFGGAVITVCIEVWIAVRLSLIAVETFAEGRFHLTAYWPLARGSFWRLLFSYLLVFIEIGAFLLLLAIAVAILGGVVALVGLPHGPDLGRRILLLGLAGVAALLGAVLFVVPSTLICACQAFAYRAIATAA